MLMHRKRGLSPYDNKRYLLVDLLNRSINSNTHDYGDYKLVAQISVQLSLSQAIEHWACTLAATAAYKWGAVQHIASSDQVRVAI